MNIPPKHPNWIRLVIVIVAMLPLIALYSAPTSWTRQIGLWAWLLLAIGNGLMWLCLERVMHFENDPAILPGWQGSLIPVT